MIDPLPIWKLEFDKIPPAADQVTGAKNQADWVDQRVTGKLILGPSPALSPPPTFTWQKAIFQATLLALVPSPDPVAPRIKIANAWRDATMASTLVVSAGTVFAPPPAPSNGIASAPPVALIDAPSVMGAYATLVKDILAMPLAPGPGTSKLPDMIYAAFKALTYTVTGVDTSPTPAGPFPIMAPMVPVM